MKTWGNGDERRQPYKLTGLLSESRDHRTDGQEAGLAHGGLENVVKRKINYACRESKQFLGCHVLSLVIILTELAHIAYSFCMMNIFDW